jgi:hypothetical protein
MKKRLLIGATAFVTIIIFALTFAQTPADSTTPTTITSTGTISQFNPDTIVVRTTASAEPVSYSYTKTTTYVDENGNPVSSKTVKAGLPVTVYYDKEPDWRLVATKVILRKATSTTTTTPTPSAPALIGRPMEASLITTQTEHTP